MASLFFLFTLLGSMINCVIFSVKFADRVQFSYWYVNLFFLSLPAGGPNTPFDWSKKVANWDTSIVHIVSKF